MLLYKKEKDITIPDNKTTILCYNDINNILRSFNMYKLFYIIMIFFVYSIVGWFMESVINSIDNKKIMNRGVLFGPWCPIYGIGATSITIFNSIIHLNSIYIFIICAIGASIIEYFIGYYLEKKYENRWWDYSQFKLNLNGRICLYSALLFGTFGLVILYINKYINIFIDNIPSIYFYLIISIILIIFIFDMIYTNYILRQIKIDDINSKKDNTDELKKLMIEKIRQKR